MSDRRPMSRRVLRLWVPDLVPLLPKMPLAVLKFIAQQVRSCFCLLASCDEPLTSLVHHQQRDEVAESDDTQASLAISLRKALRRGPQSLLLDFDESEDGAHVTELVSRVTHAGLARPTHSPEDVTRWLSSNILQKVSQA